jgi:mandelate racemase
MSACLLAATPTSDWLEYVDTVSPVLAEPLRVENGDAIVPTAPGAALAWDEPAVARFLVC